MPEKICECGNKVHVRVRICPKCKKEFVKKAKKIKQQKNLNKIVEKAAVGEWIDDLPKGFPKQEIPEPLKKIKKTSDFLLDNEEIYDYIMYEGLGYCIMTYIQAENIQDEKLKDMWKNCRKQMLEILKYVAKVCGRE